jgi:deoxyribodipyrimidine photolyase
MFITTARYAAGSPGLGHFCTSKVNLFARRSIIMSASQTKPGSVSVAWFRVGDLRLTDHEPLHQAISTANTIIPFFCLDDRLLQPPPDSLLQLPATGPYRLAAILEAVHSLKTSLHELGSELITTTGNTADALEHLVTTAITATTATSPSPSHITLHYYPCLLNFDGTLGKYFEKEVTERFLHAAAALGIPASVQPCTLGGGGGGTSLLYLPQDIHTIHSSITAGTARAAEGIVDNDRALQTVVELLENKPSMTDFRKLIQTTTPIQRPLPPLSLSSMPPLPVAIRTTEQLQSSNIASNKKCSFKSLERIVEGSDSWKEYYKAAGAEAALQNLKALVFGDGEGTFSPALVDTKRIGGRVVRVQRPPVTEKEVQARLDRLFIGESSSPGAAGHDGGGSDGDSTPPSGGPLMNSYRESRMNASNGLETSAMLSLSLSLGTLSIRTLYWTTLEAMVLLQDDDTTTAEKEDWQWREPIKESPGHHWLLMHLGIRDFFTYYALKAALSLEKTTTTTTTATTITVRPSPGCHPSLKSYDVSGPGNRTDLIWSTNQDFLSSWAQGHTGFPFVDASMRELAQTGWCSNRGRQNVASFLSKALHVDWRLGAEIFASLLLDHDVAVNWASWAYVAGVGADPRDRVFKTVTQGEKYDPKGDYIVEWVPQVDSEDGKDSESVVLRHRPWERKAEGGYLLYPAPIIDPTSQVGKGPPSLKK